MFFTNIEIHKNNLNNSWRNLFNEKKLTVSKINLGSKEFQHKFFTIGSCFAQNLRDQFEQFNIETFPKYNKIDFDKKMMMIDVINFGGNHLNFYSPISILQEFKRSFENDQSFLPIEVKGFFIEDGKKVVKENKISFQDPYRREVFANTFDDCLKLSNKINSCVKDGLEKSDVFIITLGLVEVFKNKTTLKVFNQIPNYLDWDTTYNDGNLEYCRMTYPEVLDSLKEITRFLKKINSNNIIIFSVSPIPLAMTFSNNDVYVANTYSKATLRAAVEMIIDQNNGIYYFPAFEIAMNAGSNFFQDRDLRHAKKEYVDVIMQAFLKCIS